MSGPESPPAKRRFIPVTEVDVQAAEQASVPTKTKEATDFRLRIFSSFCKENDQNVDLTTCSPKDLNDILCRFYIGMRTLQGDYYMKATYLAARAALSRYFVTVLHRAECNVFRNPVFKQSNVVLDGVLKKKKAVGLELKPEHKAAICMEDLVKLNSYFEDVLDAADPVKLTYFLLVSSHLTLHFAFRGAEVQIQLKKQDIVFEVDRTGKEYVTLKRDFVTKNCAGGVDGREFQSCGRLQDPVQIAAIKKLLTKLHPEVDRVFQRALPGIQEEPTWFAKMPLGHGVVGNMLPRISSAAQLSKRYTNHCVCVRATSIVLLKSAGFDDRSICYLTGHKNTQSLNSNCGPTEEEMRSLSSALDSCSAKAEPSKLTVLTSPLTSNWKGNEDCAVEETNRVKWRRATRRSVFRKAPVHQPWQWTRRKPSSSMLRSTLEALEQLPHGLQNVNKCWNWRSAKCAEHSLYHSLVS